MIFNESSDMLFTQSPFQLHPLLRVALCFAIGVFLGDALYDVVDSGWWMAGLLLVLALSFCLRLMPAAQSVGIFLACVLAGCLRVAICEDYLRRAVYDEPVAYEGIVFSEPQVRGKVIRFELRLVSGSMAGQKVQAALLRDTVDNRWQRLHVGDGLFAVSVMEQPRNFGLSNFSYVRYLEGRGMAASTFIFYDRWQKRRVSLSGLTTTERVRLQALRLRQHLLSRLRQWGMDDETLGLVAAMALGEKSLLPKATREVFSAGGVSHVLALSGLHLSIIYMLLTLLMRGHRWDFWRETVAMAVVWSFVLLVGLPVSVVRSAIMLTTCSLIALMGRQNMSLNTLSLAAIIILMANPLSFYDIGFQLSFLSVASIQILYWPVRQSSFVAWANRFGLTAMLASLTVVSFVAQVATAPLVAYYFGTFSFTSLLANLIVVPCAYLILGGVLLLFLFSSVSWSRSLLLTLLGGVVSFQDNLLTRMASWPWSHVDGLRLSLAQLILLYVAIASLVFVCWKLFLRRRRSLC